MMSTAEIILVGLGIACLGLFGFLRLLDRSSTHHAHRKP